MPSSFYFRIPNFNNHLFLHIAVLKITNQSMFLRSVVVSAVGINFENLGLNPSLPASQILLVPCGFPARAIIVQIFPSSCTTCTSFLGVFPVTQSSPACRSSVVQQPKKHVLLLRNKNFKIVPIIYFSKKQLKFVFTKIKKT